MVFRLGRYFPGRSGFADCTQEATKQDRCQDFHFEGIPPSPFLPPAYSPSFLLHYLFLSFPSFTTCPSISSFPSLPA